MKKILALTLMVLIVVTVCGQKSTTIPKIVIITKTAKLVPPGKKWILEAGKTTKVQVSYGVLNSGTMCNALFLSNPQMIMNVNRGDIYNSVGYGIVFKNHEKVPYTNNYTYELTPISFVDKNFSLNEFQNKMPEDVGVSKLVFVAGESVFVGNCLESIELSEISMTSQDLLAEKKKQDQQLEKANKFCIPIDPEKYVEPGTKPALKDSFIMYVIFESPAVLFQKKKEKRGGLDNVHQWILSLTQTQFEMRTSGLDEIYTVIGVKYDNKLRSQEFQLADETGQFTHKLNLCYSNSSQSYTVMFSSVDYKDNYQFQQVSIKEIKFQNK